MWSNLQNCIASSVIRAADATVVSPALQRGESFSTMTAMESRQDGAFSSFAEFCK
jgi:hypothetical protein